MSAISYVEECKNFRTINDYLRFGLTCANKANLHYGHGTDSAWDDIWMLITGSLFLPYDVNPILLNTAVTDTEKQLLANNLSQRIQHFMPVPYITSEAYFCDLSFYVDKRVLIPRSPIAELIKNQFSPWVDPLNVTKIMDLCTGSGCIGIACSYAFPDATISLVDISKDALDVAIINQNRHDLNDSIEIIKSDCFNEVPFAKYDIIVSNPPYVGTDEMQVLPKEYQHEPNLALEASNNGLSIVARILKDAHKYLNDDGILVVEVGNSADALIDAYPDVPFLWLDFENGGDGVFLLTAEQLRSL